MAAASTAKSALHVTEGMVRTAGVTAWKRYTAAVDVPSLTAGLQDTVDVTVTGVKRGDIVLYVGPSDLTALSADVQIISAVVTADDTVRVVAFNTTAGTLDAASETCEFIVLDRNA